MNRMSLPVEPKPVVTQIEYFADDNEQYAGQSPYAERRVMVVAYASGSMRLTVQALTSDGHAGPWVVVDEFFAEPDVWRVLHATMQAAPGYVESR